MLKQICEEIRNFFVREAHVGTYTIAGGRITPLDFCKEGQRFWIVGSDLNDGVYTYHADGITDDDDVTEADLTAETFNGSVCTMAVPKAVMELASEISGWQDKYGDAAASPYQSESFNGYSYTKASGANGTGGTADWRTMYGNRLKAWRKTAI